MNGQPPQTSQESAPFVGLSAKWSSVLAGSLALFFGLTALISVILVRDGEVGIFFGLSCVVLAVGLLALIWFDLREFRLPDVINLALLLAGAAIVFHGVPQDLPWRCLAALSGFLVIWGLQKLWQYSRGYPGIGLGDAKLMAVGGMWLGIWQLPFLFLGASILGLMMSAIRIVMRTEPNSSESVVIPFGPAIAVTIWFLWIFPIIGIF